MKEGTRVFFDNRFTTINLLDELRKRKIGGTGTLRENMAHGIPLTNKREVQKWKRGISEVASADKC